MKATADELDRISKEGKRRWPLHWDTAIAEATSAARKLDVNHLSLANRCLLAAVCFHILHTFKKYFTGSNQSQMDADLERLRLLEEALESKDEEDQGKALVIVRALRTEFLARKGVS